MNTRTTFAAVVVLAMGAASARAVVIEQEVTPLFVKQHPNVIAIKLERRDDGLVHVKVTCRPAKPRYLVGHFTLRKGSTVFGESSFASFTRGETAYSVSLLPEYLADSALEISERSFASHAGQDVPLPGGTDYIIRLEQFAPSDLVPGRERK
jgi:hypothetical protein